MDSEQAKRILIHYRPGDTNSVDHRLSDALELARHDPELAAWFGQHCAAHAKNPAPPPRPATLPAKPAATADQGDSDHVLPLNKPALFMIAAAVLVLAGFALWSLFAPRQNTFESFRDRMARLVQRSYPMKMAAKDQAQIRDYFRTNSALADFELPRNLEKLPGLGGAVFTWHNQPVALLGLSAGANTNLYLFVMSRSVFADPPPTVGTQFNRVGRLMTAGWSAGDRVYLLAGPNDEAALKNFLE